MVDPVKNVCGHSYSNGAIQAHIYNNRNRPNVRCPVAGCTGSVTKDSLEDNAVLAYQIRQKNKN